jgi:hypothetical protein
MPQTCAASLPASHQIISRDIERVVVNFLCALPPSGSFCPVVSYITIFNVIMADYESRTKMAVGYTVWRREKSSNRIILYEPKLIRSIPWIISPRAMSLRLIAVGTVKNVKALCSFPAAQLHHIMVCHSIYPSAYRNNFPLIHLPKMTMINAN